MNDHLKNIIDKLTESLENIPNGILIGQIRKGNSTPEIEEDERHVLVEYIEFLKVCDGASLGQWIVNTKSDSFFKG